ncbi:hypothetical protein PVAND_016405 [Polypedilum vanderplanki]|uniref:Leucine rich repeat protein n=1 Tax=Polypedilum vanderplanki TaxID=319348 RepID=A0A9J6BF04_POLVA|nr:hypothetical protein PVAND_016405 [Polypedilum vanderplanki]
MNNFFYDIMNCGSSNTDIYLLFHNLEQINKKITSTSDFQKKHVTFAMFAIKRLIPEIPRKIKDFFPNLRKIDLTGIELKKISKENFKSFPKMDTLKIDSNKLRYLPNDLFEFTPFLVSVNFSYNKIDRIGANIFDNCKYLMEVDFRENKTINVFYKNNKMKLEELKTIFERNCEPMKSLKHLSEGIVIKNMKKKDAKEIFLIAKHCGLEKLKNKAEKLISSKRRF